MGERIVDGRFVSPPTLWRSSPRGVDLLGLFEFNPNHVVARAFDDRQAHQPVPFVEYTAALSLVAIGVIAFAAWRAGYRPRAGWIWMTAGFAALALGPFVHIAGINTYVPGPWALLRYVPLFGAARTPTRFAVVAALGLAILLAGALAAIGRRYPHRRGLITAAVGAALILELAPAPRTLYSAGIPGFYDVIAADHRPVRIIELPFGVRDGTFTAGNFSARSLYYQTHHGKKLIGGYLSRISQKRVMDMRRQPTLKALMTLSEGGTLSPEDEATVRGHGAEFLERSRVGYVVINHGTSPTALVDLVTGAWQLEELAREGQNVLYRPRIELAAEQHKISSN